VLSSTSLLGLAASSFVYFWSTVGLESFYRSASRQHPAKRSLQKVLSVITQLEANDLNRSRSLVRLSCQPAAYSDCTAFPNMATAPSSAPRILIYLLRRDLRLSDNPVFYEIHKTFNSDNGSPPFTHLLPIYVFPAHQVEVSGFINGPEKSPYPEARSRVAGFWRCGTHRAKFMAESVWDLKSSLQAVGSDLAIRAGMLVDVVRDAIDQIEKSSEASNPEVTGVWMTTDEGVEEKEEEKGIQGLVQERGKQFRLFTDAKFYIDEYVSLPQPLPASSKAACIPSFSRGTPS
jgi:DNA photolyase